MGAHEFRNRGSNFLLPQRPLHPFRRQRRKVFFLGLEIVPDVSQVQSPRQGMSGLRLAPTRPKSSGHLRLGWPHQALGLNGPVSPPPLHPPPSYPLAHPRPPHHDTTAPPRARPSGPQEEGGAFGTADTTAAQHKRART